MEHRVVGGVGGIGPVDAAERHDPQRRLPLFHHADLHGAGLRPQEQRVGCPGHGEIEVVERIAGRVLRPDRQRLEVMPLILDLGAVDALESQPPHDLLHAADRLGDRVQMAQPDGIAGERDIDGFGLRDLPGDAVLRRLERGRDRLLGVVEVPATGGAIVGRQAAEQLLDRLQSAALRPEKLDPCLLERHLVASRIERGRGVGPQAVQFGRERFQRNGCHCLTRPRPAPAGRGPCGPAPRRHRSRWDRRRPFRPACAGRDRSRSSRGRR
jgi:hypothetical protein